MSLTRKGSKAEADVANKAATSPAIRFFFMRLPGNKTVDVVIKGKCHQHQQQSQSDLLADFHHPLGERTAFDNLDNIIQQMPAIQYRNGQQIEHAKADADQRQE